MFSLLDFFIFFFTTRVLTPETVCKTTALYLQYVFFFIIPPEQSNKYTKHKIYIINILKLLKNKEFFSFKATARAFKISYFTLYRRYNIDNSKHDNHKIQQNLTNTKKSILIWWIKQYTITRAPLMNLLLRDFAY